MASIKNVWGKIGLEDIGKSILDRKCKWAGRIS